MSQLFRVMKNECFSFHFYPIKGFLKKFCRSVLAGFLFYFLLCWVFVATRAFPAGGDQGLLSVGRRLLPAAASLAAERV